MITALPVTRALTVSMVCAISACVTAAARAQKSASTSEQRDPRWSAIARGLGREGKVDDGYYRVEFPRTDLSVRIGEHTLAPAFEMTSYFAFAPAGTGRVLCMGELVLRDSEVHTVMDEARRQGISIAALHNHLIGQSPPILYAHVMTIGDPASIAQKLHRMLERTSTPLGAAPAGGRGEPATWAAANAILGQPHEAGNETAEWEFPRHERITEDGIAVRSSGTLETASEVVFQRLTGGRVATTGEIFLAPSEVTAVSGTLEAGGIAVTAIHNHMVHETPKLYWLHWYATGDATSLARTIHSALERTNGASRSAGEKEPAESQRR